MCNTVISNNKEGGSVDLDPISCRSPRRSRCSVSVQCIKAEMSVIVIVTLYAKDSQEAIKRLQFELSGAAKVYGKDEGTLEWLPVQDMVDRRAFSVFERFDSERVSCR